MFFQSQKKDLGFVTKVTNNCSLGLRIQRSPHQTVITSPAPPFLRQLKFSLLTKNWFWRLIVPCSTVLDQSEIQRGQLSSGCNGAISLIVTELEQLYVVLSWLKAGMRKAVSERCCCQKGNNHRWCLSYLHSLCWTKGNSKQTSGLRSGISSHISNCSSVSAVQSAQLLNLNWKHKASWKSLSWCYFQMCMKGHCSEPWGARLSPERTSEVQ